jgi:ferredoxin
MKVVFAKSGVSTIWTGEHDSLLEAGEAEGLDLDFGCRVGNCTACQQPMQAGEVDYPYGHNGEPEDGHILLCCSVPKSSVTINA